MYMHLFQAFRKTKDIPLVMSPTPLYHARMHLVASKENLLILCEEGIIITARHLFYRSLATFASLEDYFIQDSTDNIYSDSDIDTE